MSKERIIQIVPKYTLHINMCDFILSIEEYESNMALDAVLILIFFPFLLRCSVGSII